MAELLELTISVFLAFGSVSILSYTFDSMGYGDIFYPIKLRIAKYYAKKHSAEMVLQIINADQAAQDAEYEDAGDIMLLAFTDLAKKVFWFNRFECKYCFIGYFSLMFVIAHFLIFGWWISSFFFWGASLFFTKLFVKFGI